MLLPGEEPAAFLKEALQDLRRLHGAGAGGRELARRRADLIDLTLISLFRGAEHQLLGASGYREPGLAVVAVGGYGRRELCPASDVDLMLLYRPEEGGRVQEMAERLFYPLWDAGLELGHGARTVEECLEVCAQNIELETSLLQARLLVGDQELFRSLTDRLVSSVSADGGRSFVERLLAAREARRQAHGPAGALLEPDLKEGRGGLRDVHELLWVAAALHGTTGLDGLAATGWLPSPAIAALEEAVDVLLWARTSLHYVAGRRLDRLHLDYQEDVAALASWPEGRTVEAVMARVFSAAQTVGFLTEDGWSGAVQQVGVPLAVSTRLPVRQPQTREGRRAVLTELLREGTAGVARLERLSHAGVLSDWLPGWEAIRSLGQRDTLHTYTVDGHSLRCAAEAVQLAREGDPDQVASTVAAELSLSPLWEGFLLACLLHDLGKGAEGDHAVVGSRLAADVAAALGEAPEVQADVAFLVREHLLLPDTATRRDLDDPVLLERLADRIAGRERLQMLYLLTIADGRATGPAVSTPWRTALVQELFLKVLALIDGRTDRGGRGRRSRGAARRAALVCRATRRGVPADHGRPAPVRRILGVGGAGDASGRCRGAVGGVLAPTRAADSALRGPRHARHHHHERPVAAAGGRPHRPHLPRGRLLRRQHPAGALGAGAPRRRVRAGGPAGIGAPARAEGGPLPGLDAGGATGGDAGGAGER